MKLTKKQRNWLHFILCLIIAWGVSVQFYEWNFKDWSLLIGLIVANGVNLAREYYLFKKGSAIFSRFDIAIGFVGSMVGIIITYLT